MNKFTWWDSKIDKRLSLLVFSLESPGGQGPIYCQHHFPWDDKKENLEWENKFFLLTQ